MTIDLKTELAKQEYVKAINETNAKYDLPLTIIELILNGITNEVRSLKENKIKEEFEKLPKDEEVKEEKESEK